jgi:hypothetical protein
MASPTSGSLWLGISLAPLLPPATDRMMHWRLFAPVTKYAIWFDFVVLIVIRIGVVRGRQRGLSEELLSLFGGSRLSL